MKSLALIVIVLVLLTTAMCAQKPNEEQDPPKSGLISGQVKPQEEQKPASLTQEGQRLMWDRKYEEAKRKFEEAIKADSKDIEAYKGLAEVCGYLEDQKGAASALDRGIGSNPDNSELWKIKANLLFASGNLEEALESYGKALEINPEDHSLYSDMAMVYISENNHEKAKKIFEESIEKNPNSFKVYENYAKYWNDQSFSQQDPKELALCYEKAAQYYDETLSRMGIDETLWKAGIMFQKGDVLYRKWQTTNEDKEAARQALESYIKENPEDVRINQGKKMLQDLK